MSLKAKVQIEAIPYRWTWGSTSDELKMSRRFSSPRWSRRKLLRSFGHLKTTDFFSNDVKLTMWPHRFTLFGKIKPQKVRLMVRMLDWFYEFTRCLSWVFRAIHKVIKRHGFANANSWKKIQFMLAFHFTRCSRFAYRTTWEDLSWDCMPEGLPPVNVTGKSLLLDGKQTEIQFQDRHSKLGALSLSCIADVQRLSNFKINGKLERENKIFHSSKIAPIQPLLSSYFISQIISHFFFISHNTNG